jgi:phosphoenolpyruvate carboxykinase (ATP)
LGVTSQNRKLIGSDEIGWGENGVFNIEGGCYTKILNANNKIDSEIQSSIKYGTLV